MAELYIAASLPDAPRVLIWPRGEVPEGTIQENKDFFIDLTDVDCPDDAELSIDDEILQPLRNPGPRWARWKWNPGFNAGEFEATIRLRGRPYIKTSLTADPDLAKLTRTQFDTMVREIAEDTLALVALSPGRYGFARGSGGIQPPIARLEFIRSRIEAIERTVLKIAGNPIRWLSAEELRVPVRSARGTTAGEYFRSLTPGNIFTPPVQLSGQSRAFPKLVRKRAREPTNDIPEHRLIKQALQQWSSWLRAVGSLLRIKAGEQEAGVHQRWADRTKTLAVRLETLLKLPLFREVSSGFTSGSIASPAFRRVHRYQEFYRLYRDMRLGMAQIVGEHLNIPIARTFDLYELWCYLRIIRTLVQLCGSASVDITQFLKVDERGIQMTAGTGLVRIGRSLFVSFQREYREYWLEADGAGSFSRRMIPDISVCGGNIDKPLNVIVLDAKYRVGGDLNEALSSLHMYRDALVQRSPQSGSRQDLVHAAYLLTPQFTQTSGSWEHASMPGRLFHPVYRSTFKFGAISLRPGMTPSELASAVNTIFIDAGIPLAGADFV